MAASRKDVTASDRTRLHLQSKSCRQEGVRQWASGLLPHMVASSNIVCVTSITNSETRTHANLANLGASQIQTEMTKVEQAFVNIFGKKPAYMRPPNLGTSTSMLSTLKSMNYVVITDDIDSGDWNQQTAAQSEQKFTAAGASGNGHIPLMHEVYDSTVNTLVPWLINWAKTNNLKIVTVGTFVRIHFGGRSCLLICDS